MTGTGTGTGTGAGVGGGVQRVTADEFVAGHATVGMTRIEALAEDGLWAGLAVTDPGAWSGWHHHADHETVAYVTDGVFRVEFGPGGADVVEAGAGEFVRVPPHVVHREGNPSGAEARLVVVRAVVGAGAGPVVVNVDGPDPAGGG